VNATLDVSFTDRFWPSVYELSAAENKQVVKAVAQLSTDPLNDSLRLNPVQGDGTGRKYTCRASDDIRLFGFKRGSVLLLERAGHHDPIYELSRRVDVVVNEGTGRIHVVDRDQAIATAEAQPAARQPTPPTADEPRPLDHWADGELREAGLSDGEIAAVRACTTVDDLFALDVDDETLSLILDLVEQTPEQWRTPSIDEEAEAVERFRQAIIEHGALEGISPLFTPEEVEKIAAAPIEDWMIFLHPDQRSFVDRRFEGPARVRGSAGSGKTVVALHRAAALVARFREEAAVEGTDAEPVLFTTFIKSLPPVFEQLYRRLPSTRPDDAIEFVHVDKLAYRICTEAGDRPTLDPRRIDSAFAGAFKKVVVPDSPLAVIDATRDYLRDEITQVIKGRGIRDLDEYLAVERTGRRTRFTEALRRQVWDLKQEWDNRMAREGVIDFPDIVLRARDHARRRPQPTYRAAIVDEAQDLTLVGLQLIRVLVNGPAGKDRADGLLVVGDGAQKIYAGGFTLRQAGVEVRGRTAVLRVNYRNTQQIIDAAMAVAGKETVEDLGDTYARGDAEAEAVRSGNRPILVGCTGLDDEIRFVGERISDLVDAGTVGYGDIAVAASTNQHVKDVRNRLMAMQIPTVGLEDYTGQPVDKVKVGTHFRIKGLEFKVVFLPCLGDKDFPRRRAPGQSQDEYDEQRALAISQLFVAMTRARDALFLLASGNPSSVLEPALDRFEVIDS
jgi:superfamily I DNA/RNA helicase